MLAYWIRNWDKNGYNHRVFQPTQQVKPNMKLVLCNTNDTHLRTGYPSWIWNPNWARRKNKWTARRWRRRHMRGTDSRPTEPTPCCTAPTCRALRRSERIGLRPSASRWGSTPARSRIWWRPCALECLLAPENSSKVLKKKKKKTIHRPGYLWKNHCGKKMVKKSTVGPHFSKEIWSGWIQIVQHLIVQDEPLFVICHKQKWVSNNDFV